MINSIPQPSIAVGGFMDEKCIVAFVIESWRGNRKYPVVTPLIKIARLYIPCAFPLLPFVVLRV
jgi:hypothetical protein